MGDEQRFALGARGDPTAEPGLVRDEIGRVYVIAPDGTRTLLPGNGGSQPGVLTSAEFLITEEATAANVSYAITAVDTMGQTFNIAGDHEDDFKGGGFVVNGSTGNDGFYTLTGVSFADGETTLFVAETIADDTADGNIIRGLYTAEFPVADGYLIAAIEYFVEGVWAADTANLCTGDSLSPYSYDDNLDLKSSPFDTVYDPENGGGFALNAFNDYVSNVLFGINAPGAGVRYAGVDTIAVNILTAVADPPIVPTGVLRVKIMYFTPITATPAGLA